MEQKKGIKRDWEFEGMAVKLRQGVVFGAYGSRVICGGGFVKLALVVLVERRWMGCVEAVVRRDRRFWFRGIPNL